MPGVTGAEELERLAAVLRDLEGVIVRRGVPAMAAAIGGVAAGQYAAGRGPDGKAWPRNKDGSVPLRSVTSQIRFSPRGRAIVASGPDVLQYHVETRPVFPVGALPGPWTKAAARALEQTVIGAATGEKG